MSSLSANFCCLCGEYADCNVDEHLAACRMCFNILTQAEEQSQLEDSELVSGMYDEAELAILISRGQLALAI
jgi:predicted anti-sigma-YlaC factor YlaD